MISFRFSDDSSIWFPADVEEYFGIHTGSSYLLANGHIISGSLALENGQVYHIVPRVLGGKGGFGSMLRAIGAQIEKTTSREACRDLSGRRIRDVNNEKKLKEWVSKQADREQEKEEREERRRTKRAKYLEETPGKMDNPEFVAQYSKIMEQSEKAMQEGLAKIRTGTNGSKKRKADMLDKYDRWSIVGGVNVEDLDSDDNSSPSNDGAQVGTSSTEHASHTASSSSSSSSSPSHSAEGAACRNKSKASATITSAEFCEEVSAAATCDSGPSDTAISLSDVNGEPAYKVAKLNDNNPDSLHDSDLMAETASAVKTAIVEKETSNGFGTNTAYANVPVNLDDYSHAGDLQVLGMERLKAELMRRGLKCGGSLQERAQRLFSVKGVASEDIPTKLLSKGKGQGKSTK